MGFELRRLGMNKKGQEADSKGIGPIIAAVVAAVVLVIVAIALYNFFSGGGASYLTNLPGFNNTKPLVVDLEMLRYSIANDNVQFYDGTTWRDFEKQGAVEMNGKKVNYLETKNSFTGDYFQSKTLREKNPMITVKDASGNTQQIKLILTPQSGPGGGVAIIINGVGDYLLTINNGVEVWKVSGWIFVSAEYSPIDKSLTDTEKLAIEKAIEWRDSILAKPIAITYYVGTDKRIAYVCADRGKYNVNHDLSIDLGQEVKADAKC